MWLIVTEVVKMQNTKVDVKRSGNHYFKVYQKLLKQRVRIDQELLKLQKKFLEATVGRKGVHRKKYVKRLSNTTTLIKAIHNSMLPNKEMTMDDIMESLVKKELYHTNSHSYYTMVNNKLHQDKKHIKNPRHGIFVYKSRKVATVV